MKNRIFKLISVLVAVIFLWQPLGISQKFQGLSPGNSSNSSGQVGYALRPAALDEEEIRAMEWDKNEMRAKAAKKDSGVPSEDHFLPSLTQIRQLAKRSNAYLIEESKVVELLISNLREIFENSPKPYRVSLLLACLEGGNEALVATTLTANLLADYAEALKCPVAKLRAKLSIPKWAQAVIIKVKPSNMVSYRRILMEEVFHVLEGEHQSSRWWKGYNSYDRIKVVEKINDFEMLIFYPVEKLEEFKSGYSPDWSLEEKRALLNTYRVNRNPNKGKILRDILQLLLKDISEGCTIRVRDKTVLISEVILGHENIDSFPLLIQYLEALLKSERFSQHEDLFLEWQLPNTSQADIEKVEDTSQFPLDQI